MTKVSKTERDEALERLRGWFPKGATVWTILRHVSRSGMQRTIGVVSLAVRDKAVDGRLVVDARHPNWATATALGMTEDRESEGVKINGCGMDMGFSIAYDLGRVLYGDGYALKHSWL